MFRYYKPNQSHFAAILTFAAFAYSTDYTESDVSIARFSGDALAAVSYTFDDGLRDQVTIALPALEKYGFHATFFPVAEPTKDRECDACTISDCDWCAVSWEKWKEISANGHEIGNHSWSHPNLRFVDPSRLDIEINKSYDFIAEKVGIAPFSFSYPYSEKNDTVRAIVKQRHFAAREFQTDFGRFMTSEDCNALLTRAIRNHDWFIPIMHGVYNGNGHFENKGVFESHLEFVAENRDNVWVAPFGTVSRYIQQRDSARICIIEMSENEIIFSIGSPLDTNIYNQDLTVVIPAECAISASALSNGSGLRTRILRDKILVEVPVSAETVSVKWGTAQVSIINPHIYPAKSRASDIPSSSYNVLGRMQPGLFSAIPKAPALIIFGSHSELSNIH